MSIRRVNIVMLCEDSQQEAFMRRFLKGMGWNAREFRVEKSPSAKGSAEQWVREKFPDELNIYRKRRQRAASALIAMTDADDHQVQDRVQDFEKACAARQIPFRTADEAVAIAVPKRNIETWIHCLKGNPVDEKSKYPKLERKRDCKAAVDRLVGQCHSGVLNADAPPSLAMGCDEYTNRIKPLTA